MQASSDAFLVEPVVPAGALLFAPTAGYEADPQHWAFYDAELFGLYAGICGWVLARARARAGGMAPEIAGYIGGSEAFAEALVKYGRSYAQQVASNYELFRKERTAQWAATGPK